MSQLPVPANHQAHQSANLALGIRPDDHQQDPKRCTDAQGQAFWRAITCDPVFLTDPPAQPISPGSVPGLCANGFDEWFAGGPQALSA